MSPTARVGDPVFRPCRRRGVASSCGAAGLVKFWCVGGKGGGGALVFGGARWGVLQCLVGRWVVVPAQLGCWWCPELELEKKAAWLCPFSVLHPVACDGCALQPSTMVGGAFSSRFAVLGGGSAVFVGVLLPVRCSVFFLCSVRVFGSCTLYSG